MSVILRGFNPLLRKKRTFAHNLLAKVTLVCNYKEIMKALVVLSMVIASSLLSGCQPDNVTVVDGTYTGKFTVSNATGIQTGSVTLVLKDGNYTSTGSANRIPAGGSGTFSIDKGNLTFNDRNFWTADFDWNLILSGQYSYTFDGARLVIFSRKNGVGQYKYILERN